MQYKKYETRGFEVTDIHGNNEFNIQYIINAVIPANVHEYSKDEHVGFIDNVVTFIKERVPCVCYAAPYRKYTRLMTRLIIKGFISIINFFSIKKWSIRGSGTLNSCRRTPETGFE